MLKVFIGISEQCPGDFLPAGSEERAQTIDDLGVSEGKEAYYFSHDANARNDIKIKAMMSRYGYEGYGMYWAIVEMLRETKDYELPWKIIHSLHFNGSLTDVQRMFNSTSAIA